jgi:hypothetical protein
MSSRGKKKTTMAKLTRESRLRERRVEKKARKDARRNAPPMDPDGQMDSLGQMDPDGQIDSQDETGLLDAPQPVSEEAIRP